LIWTEKNVATSVPVTAMTPSRFEVGDRRRRRCRHDQSNPLATVEQFEPERPRRGRQAVRIDGATISEHGPAVGRQLAFDHWMPLEA
jgi:hypothetical protein